MIVVTGPCASIEHESQSEVTTMPSIRRAARLLPIREEYREDLIFLVVMRVGYFDRWRGDSFSIHSGRRR